MKYERLTHRNHGCIEEYCEERHCIYCDKDGDCHFDKKSKHIDVSCDCFYAMAERLAELEDKIEQGTLIEFPCKVGDTVYFIIKSGNEFVLLEDTCIGFTIADGETLIGLENIPVAVNKYYFTREEAEKRLLELKGEPKL